jgi:hypothetical protein
VIAAAAGAKRVYAVCRPTRYGSVEDIWDRTLHLARLVGVEPRLELVPTKSPQVLGVTDILTNSGHVRPIDAHTIAALKPTAVIPLMYEAWELREGEVDLAEARTRGVRVAGTNERHAAIDVFSYLGAMAVKLLLDGGVPVYKSRILLLCDNPFAPFIREALTKMGAKVDVAPRLPDVHEPQEHDAILVAMRPRSDDVLSPAQINEIARYWRAPVVAQFWGDVDRREFARARIQVTPTTPPERTHMGILPSSIGPEPIVRLQSGGLKVGEVLLKTSPSSEDLEFIQPVSDPPGFAASSSEPTESAVGLQKDLAQR